MDDMTVHSFVVHVSGGLASIFDYSGPFSLPIAEASGVTNDAAVAAAFNLITIPEGETVR